MSLAPAAIKAPSRTRSIAFVGLTIAIFAVSAWITIPLGPVPFTLQMFAITFAIIVLTPKEAIGSIYGYILVGAVGIPVFSGMRGGIGVLLGPTGGFLWGYLIGVPAAALLMYIGRKRGLSKAPLSAAADFGLGIVAGFLWTWIAYGFGCLQYMAVMGVSFETAFLTSIAPFIIVDGIKIVAAVACAEAVRKAVR